MKTSEDKVTLSLGISPRDRSKSRDRSVSREFNDTLKHELRKQKKKQDNGGDNLDTGNSASSKRETPEEKHIGKDDKSPNPFTHDNEEKEKNGKNNQTQTKPRKTITVNPIAIKAETGEANVIDDTKTMDNDKIEQEPYDIEVARQGPSTDINNVTLTTTATIAIDAVPKVLIETIPIETMPTVKEPMNTAIDETVATVSSNQPEIVIESVDDQKKPNATLCVTKPKRSRSRSKNRKNDEPNTSKEAFDSKNKEQGNGAMKMDTLEVNIRRGRSTITKRSKSPSVGKLEIKAPPRDRSRSRSRSRLAEDNVTKEYRDLMKSRRRKDGKYEDIYSEPIDRVESTKEMKENRDVPKKKDSDTDVETSVSKERLITNEISGNGKSGEAQKPTIFTVNVFETVDNRHATKKDIPSKVTKISAPPIDFSEPDVNVSFTLPSNLPAPSSSHEKRPISRQETLENMAARHEAIFLKSETKTSTRGSRKKRNVDAEGYNRSDEPGTSSDYNVQIAAKDDNNNLELQESDLKEFHRSKPTKIGENLTPLASPSLVRKVIQSISSGNSSDDLSEELDHVKSNNTSNEMKILQRPKKIEATVIKKDVSNNPIPVGGDNPTSDVSVPVHVQLIETGVPSDQASVDQSNAYNQSANVTINDSDLSAALFQNEASELTPIVEFPTESNNPSVESIPSILLPAIVEMTTKPPPTPPRKKKRMTTQSYEHLYVPIKSNIHIAAYKCSSENDLSQFSRETPSPPVTPLRRRRRNTGLSHASAPDSPEVSRITKSDLLPAFSALDKFKSKFGSTSSDLGSRDSMEVSRSMEALNALKKCKKVVQKVPGIVKTKVSDFLEDRKLQKLRGKPEEDLESLLQPKVVSTEKFTAKSVKKGTENNPHVVIERVEKVKTKVISYVGDQQPPVELKQEQKMKMHLGEGAPAFPILLSGATSTPMIMPGTPTSPLLSSEKLNVGIMPPDSPTPPARRSPQVRRAAKENPKPNQTDIIGSKGKSSDSLKEESRTHMKEHNVSLRENIYEVVGDNNDQAVNEENDLKQTYGNIVNPNQREHRKSQGNGTDSSKEQSGSLGKRDKENVCSTENESLVLSGDYDKSMIEKNDMKQIDDDRSENDMSVNVKFSIKQVDDQPKVESEAPTQIDVNSLTDAIRSSIRLSFTPSTIIMGDIDLSDSPTISANVTLPLGQSNASFEKSGSETPASPSSTSGSSSPLTIKTRRITFRPSASPEMIRRSFKSDGVNPEESLLCDGKLENPDESLLSELENPDDSLLSDDKLVNPEETCMSNFGFFKLKTKMIIFFRKISADKLVPKERESKKPQISLKKKSSEN
uniref:Uncharacterized protein n=1 Tax=Cacopsylla melanoneura TaxID=428564 RepID=A0A8D8MFR7_9HEMI